MVIESTESQRVNTIINAIIFGYYIRAAPKGILPIFLCWPTMSEADVGGMPVVEPSPQYSITFCCHVTGGSRGAV